MAKMSAYRPVRRTAGWADWKQVSHDDDYHDRLGMYTYQADLENGHSLSAFNDPHKKTWFAYINHPGTRAEPDQGADSGLPYSTYVGGVHDSKEAVMQAAEQKYEQMFPVGGSNTGPHDSGTDYSDLSKFMGEL